MCLSKWADGSADSGLEGDLSDCMRTDMEKESNVPKHTDFCRVLCSVAELCSAFVRLRHRKQSQSLWQIQTTVWAPAGSACSLASSMLIEEQETIKIGPASSSKAGCVNKEFPKVLEMFYVFVSATEPQSNCNGFGRNDNTIKRHLCLNLMTRPLKP